MSTQQSSIENIFGEVITSYSREQALEDGVLVDGNQEELTEVSRQHFRYPIAMTYAVFAIMEKTVTAPRSTCDFQGVWHDVCWMARSPLARIVDPTTRLFTVKIGRKNHHMKVVCGPNDDGSPCLTVMLQEES